MRQKSVRAILAHRVRSYNFTDKWAENFGHPEVGSKWLVWGPSASGKSSFVMQLAKYMSQFGRVEYYADEEGVTAKSLQMRLHRYNMKSCGGRFVVLDQASYDDIVERMELKRSSAIYIFDSWQTMNFTIEQFRGLCKRFPTKTMIWVSREERGEPAGQSARKAKYDCDVKIHVKGYAAKCLGRFIPEAGKEFVIWDEGYYNLLKGIQNL